MRVVAVGLRIVAIAVEVRDPRRPGRRQERVLDLVGVGGQHQDRLHHQAQYQQRQHAGA
jgi:hypothetical protein